MSQAANSVHSLICMGVMQILFIVAAFYFNRQSKKFFNETLGKFFSHSRKVKGGFGSRGTRWTFDFRGMEGEIYWEKRGGRNSRTYLRLFLSYPSQVGEGGCNLRVKNIAFLDMFKVKEGGLYSTEAVRGRCNIETSIPAFSRILDTPGLLDSLGHINQFMGDIDVTYGPEGFLLELDRAYLGELEWIIVACLMLYRQGVLAVHQSGLENPGTQLDFDRPFLPPDISSQLRAGIHFAPEDLESSRESYFMSDDQYRATGRDRGLSEGIGDDFDDLAGSEVLQTRTRHDGYGDFGGHQRQESCAYCHGQVYATDAESCPRCGAAYHRDCMGILEACEKCGAEFQSRDGGRRRRTARRRGYESAL